MSMFFSSPAGSARTLQATVTSRVPSRVMSMLPSPELCTDTCSISTLEAASGHPDAILPRVSNAESSDDNVVAGPADDEARVTAA